MTHSPEKPQRPRGKTRTGARVRSTATLTWLSVAFLILESVGDLGSAPAMAVYGLASVGLYVLPAVLFLVPASLHYRSVSACTCWIR